jgi:hypothetical protein
MTVYLFSLPNERVNGTFPPVSAQEEVGAVIPLPGEDGESWFSSAQGRGERTRRWRLAEKGARRRCNPT